MTKRQLEKVRAKFENLDLSRYHILTYDEMLKVNGGGSVSDDNESESSETGGHEIENSNAAVANAEVGDTLTRNDGTEVTITQGDIDWAQDYCDAHGIGWSRSEETEKNDVAKENGQAEIEENQSELGSYDSSVETNDNYSAEKAEELRAEEENLQEASNGKGNASVSAENNKSSRNEFKENVTIRNGKAEDDSFDKTKNLFGELFVGGQSKNNEYKGKACVENQSGVTILIKPENYDDDNPYTLLKSGDSYRGRIDGVIFPDGTVFKTNGNSKYAAKIDENGLYKVSGGETKDSIGNFVKSILNIGRNVFSFIREEDMYGTYNYATGSSPFLDDWLNSSRGLDIDNNHKMDTSFVPIPLNLDGSVPPASFTLSRWNEFLK